MVRLQGQQKALSQTVRETHRHRETEIDIAERCVFTFIKKVQWCDAVCLGAVQQDPFSTVLANQAAVLLHLGLVAGALAFAGVGSIGHDGTSV